MSQRKVSDTSPKPTPLSSLRLSRIDNELNDNLKSEHNLNYDSIPSSNSSIKDNNQNQFNLDIDDIYTTADFKNKDKSKSKLVVSKEDLKKASELTSLFLDTRKILRADCNIVDSNNDDSLKISSNSSISRNTIIRAEKVKTMIGVKYFYIQRMYEWNESHKESNEHPGVEGVYNPLQILRNRKIRSKYKEYPKPLHLKTLPLACNVFSKYNQPEYNHHRKKPWRMVYAIELNEIIGDTRWRTNHWHELKDPKGNLWFPIKKEKKRDLLKQRLHDKLFDENTTDDEKVKKHRRGRSSVTTTSGSDSEGGIYLFNRISRSKSPRKKHKMKDKMKNIYKGDSSSSSDINVETNSENPLNSQFFKRVNVNLNHSDSSDEIQQQQQNQQQQQPNQQLQQQPSQVPPIITINPTSPPEIGSISNVEFQRSTRKPSQEMIENIENEKPPLNCVEVIDQREKDFVKIQSNLNYFQQCCELKRQYLINIYPVNLELISGKVEYITKDQIFHIFNLISVINDELFPNYEELYLGFIEESKSIIHMINDNYNIKIDTLLSSSDRCLSEINATLSLDLRKINEELDNLENSMIKNKTIRGELKLLHHHHSGDSSGNYKFLYLCLENFIIVLLRVIWVIVNVLNVFIWIIRLVWKMIRLFI
ncbi:unnamed protein product [Candida verbasci]|uniref:Maintenance of telomere capping protein 4 n=1 Tax=Candida verbasci TaxID=1227364 RepID=A0A9W4TV19_9ASCO|nr:unnamed protein product [Candida verbasci]